MFDAPLGCCCAIVGNSVRLVHPNGKSVDIPFEWGYGTGQDDPEFILHPLRDTTPDEGRMVSDFLTNHIRNSGNINRTAKAAGKDLEKLYPFGYRSEDSEA